MLFMVIEHFRNATPLGWAEYYQGEHAGGEKARRYAAIADYLRDKGAPT
jgi:hypothetical protein